jgi:HKD family nuclease
MIRLINQPNNGNRVGDELLICLNDMRWEKFQALIAFAKRSGVKHLKRALTNFSSRGDVEIIVGIDLGGTSIEGLSMLMDSLENRGDIYICHNRNRSTFHPKLYVFRNERELKLIVGSSNITEGGLYTNYEFAVIVDLRLDNQDDLALVQEIDNTFLFYTSVENGLSHLLTEDLIETLVNREAILSENQIRRIQSISRDNPPGTREREERETIADIFNFIRVPNAPEVVIERQFISLEENEDEIHYDSAIDLDDETNIILVKYVPRAGNRTSQVHFSQQNVEIYFGLSVSQPIRLRQNQPNQPVGEIENRQLVLSEVNRNARIEVAGARVLVDNYPTEPNRPILVFIKIEDDLYEYMLILPNENGYDELNNYLNSLPRGKALASSVISLAEIRNIWPDFTR